MDRVEEVTGLSNLMQKHFLYPVEVNFHLVFSDTCVFNLVVASFCYPFSTILLVLVSISHFLIADLSLLQILSFA